MAEEVATQSWYCFGRRSLSRTAPEEVTRLIPIPRCFQLRSVLLDVVSSLPSPPDLFCQWLEAPDWKAAMVTASSNHRTAEHCCKMMVSTQVQHEYFVLFFWCWCWCWCFTLVFFTLVRGWLHCVVESLGKNKWNTHTHIHVHARTHMRAFQKEYLSVYFSCVLWNGYFGSLGGFSTKILPGAAAGRGNRGRDLPAWRCRASDLRWWPAPRHSRPAWRHLGFWRTRCCRGWWPY